jgi:hypothetical protein
LAGFSPTPKEIVTSVGGTQPVTAGAMNGFVSQFSLSRRNAHASAAIGSLDSGR